MFCLSRKTTLGLSIQFLVACWIPPMMSERYLHDCTTNGAVCHTSRSGTLMQFLLRCNQYVKEILAWLYHPWGCSGEKSGTCSLHCIRRVRTKPELFHEGTNSVSYPLHMIEQQSQNEARALSWRNKFCVLPSSYDRATTRNYACSCYLACQEQCENQCLRLVAWSPLWALDKCCARLSAFCWCCANRFEP